MKLKEFDLDMPYIRDEEYIALLMKETDCDRREAFNKYWIDVGSWKRRKFNVETRCVTSFFERIFERIDTKDCWKILVECIDGECKTSVNNLLGVYSVQVENDYDYFENLEDELSKKKLALELLMTGIQKVAASQNWDMEPFECAYNKILEAEYRNEWVWKKPVSSPDRKHRAYIFLYHELKQIDLFLIITDKSGKEIHREKILTEIPDEWEYARHLGAIKWHDNRKVALINKQRDNEWIAEF